MTMEWSTPIVEAVTTSDEVRAWAGAQENYMFMSESRHVQGGDLRLRGRCLWR